MVSWKTTLIFGIVGGALIGGVCGGVLSLFTRFALVLMFGTVAVVNLTMIDTIFSAAVGAGLGIVTGLTAGSIARAAGANKRNVFRHSADGSLASGISVGAGATLIASVNPVYAVGIAVVLGPAYFLFLEAKDASSYMFKYKSATFIIVITRILMGIGLGSVFGLLCTGLVALVVVFLVPWVATPDAIADLVVNIGLIVGAYSGAIAAINRSTSDSDIRDVIYFVSEASIVMVMAAASGIMLSWVVWKIMGIVVAIGITTFWSVTRRKHIEPR